ncbi:MAG: xanthine dehydrogenase family protein molybdopterin-binding subunit [Xanthobacteraceae bacterium]|jgi:xanthine dehydrogenase YagR molybdenum-binding subunit
MAQSQAASVTYIGQARARIDGPLKVTGTARYTSDHNFPGMLYAVPVGAIIAKGAIKAIETSRARQMPGVRAVLKRGDLPPMKKLTANFGEALMLDEPRPPLDDDVVRYYGQYVALAVADTFEQAKAAADAVAVTYAAETPNVDPHLVATDTKVVSERGNAEKSLASAPVTIDAHYAIAPETHNPIETHATVATWDGNELTLYETSQGVVNHRNVLADMLGLPRNKVRVIAKFIGSGFGSKLWPWSQSPLAAAAAMTLGKPIKLVLSRPMMFHAAGHRPRIEQRVRLGAGRDGKLVALQQDYVNSTSILDDYEENCGEATPHMYSVPNLRITSGLAKRNIGTPTAMRGPGAVPGLFATESAMDELAVKLGMDPVELHLINEPQIDEGLGVPFSSRHLKECLTLGAEKFGWSKRDPKIGSMQRDGKTLGWGMAACSWIAARFDCSAAVELRDDGTVRVASASQDIGTGTYTVMAQVVAEMLGIPIERVAVDIGDSSLPSGALSGGSMLTASLIVSIGAAIAAAGEALIAQTRAGRGTPFGGVDAKKLRFDRGRMADGNATMAFDEVLRALKVKSVSGQGSGEATFGVEGKPKFSSHSFGAHFVEVTWQADIARLRVSRAVSVIDAGRVVNPLAARNQIEGAVVMGIGMALFEGTEYDARSGAPVNANLADYIVATNADVPALDVHFIEYPDYNLNALGARGVGEIGLAGVAAALTNAIYHATGVRVRELPLKIESLL